MMQYHAWLAKGERVAEETEIKPGVFLVKFLVGTRGRVARYELVDTKDPGNKHPDGLRFARGTIARPKYRHRTFWMTAPNFRVQITAAAEAEEFLVEQMRFYAEKLL